MAEAATNDSPQEGDLCATFTVPECPTIWVQVLLGSINLAYPSTEEPLTFLQQAGIAALPGLTLEHWQARRFATFQYEPCPPELVARFVDQLVVALHELDPNYPISVEFERLR